MKVTQIVYAQKQAVFPRYSYRCSAKQFTMSQLAAYVLLAFYFKMSYCDIEELP